MDDAVERKVRELHNRGEISDLALRELLGDDGTANGVGDDLDEEAKQIIARSLEIGDRMLTGPPEGQTCERDGCDRDAVAGPGDEWLCREHQDEFFAAWHG